MQDCVHTAQGPAPLHDKSVFLALTTNMASKISRVISRLYETTDTRIGLRFKHDCR